MNELLELEHELGPQLHRALAMIIPTDESAFDDRAPVDSGPSTDEDVAIVSVGVEQRSVTATPRRLRIVGVAAAIIVVVGLGAIFNLSDHDRSPTTDSSEPTTPSESIAATTIPLPDPENPPGVYLPTADLPGFTLADISVGHRTSMDRPPRPAERSTLRYVRHGTDGVSVAAMITLMGKPSTTVDSFDGKQPPLLVHGQPAHIFDSGEGIVSSWQENGVDASVRGWGVSWDDVATVAEQTSVDPTNFAVTLPSQALEGFEPSMSDTSPPADAVTTSLHFVAVDPHPGAFVDVANWANDDLMTLDSIEVGFKLAGLKIDSAVVRDLPAIVATSIAGEFGPLITVAWIEDGYQFTVAGRTDKDNLLGLANSLAPATLVHARELRASLDTFRLGLPELDRARLTNDLDVSIRTMGTGANVICLHAPIRRCQLLVSESSLIGDYQHEITSTFWINDTAWLIGWAGGTHSPRWFVDNAAGEAIPNVAQGGAGTFLAFPITDESAQFVFDPDAQSIYPAGSPVNSDLLS